MKRLNWKIEPGTTTWMAERYRVVVTASSDATRPTMHWPYVIHPGGLRVGFGDGFPSLTKAQKSCEAHYAERVKRASA